MIIAIYLDISEVIHMHTGTDGLYEVTPVLIGHRPSLCGHLHVYRYSLSLCGRVSFAYRYSLPLLCRFCVYKTEDFIVINMCTSTYCLYVVIHECAGSNCS